MTRGELWMSKKITINNAVKKYGDFLAINDVSLEVNEGELFTLLGPSGCGKTTLLRMLAGFNSIEAGQFYFGETLINDISAHKRDIGMVFQNYAIFPHLTVRDNVAYGLRARGIKADEVRKRVNDALDMAQISHLAERMPNQLSGGQQQRVALARAIVIEPSLLLMDEPLSNLDAKLRVQMRQTIRDLQKRLKITTIYVTHDQEEALAISDRIAVMKDGVIVQSGTPYEIYSNPVHKFVAGFIGTSNFLNGTIGEVKNISDNGELAVEYLLDGAHKTLSLKVKDADGLKPGDKLESSIRPGQVYIFESKEERIIQKGMDGGEIEIEAIMSANVEDAFFLGEYIDYRLLLESGDLIHANVYTRDIKSVIAKGSNVHIGLDSSRIRLYNSEGRVISC